MLRALLHFFGLKKYLAYLTVRPVTRLTLFSIVFLMFKPSFLRSLIREAITTKVPQGFKGCYRTA